MKRLILISALLIVITMYSYGQWEECNNGLSGGCVRALLVRGENIFAGTQNGGIFLSTDNGELWLPVNTGLMNTKVYSLEQNNDFIFAGTLDSGIFISSDKGENWFQYSSSLKDTYVESIAISDNHIYASTSKGVYISTDDGINWYLNNTGMTADYKVIELEAYGSNVYASTEEWGIFLSTDYGESWKPINSGIIPGLDMFDQIFSFAISGNYIFAGGSVVYLSTIKDDKWIQKNNGLNGQVLALAVINNYVFAGTFTGSVYLSADNGENWIQAGYGLSSMIFSLTVNNKYVFAGTYDAGVFRAKLSDLITNIGTEENEDEQYIISPNPVYDKFTFHSKSNMNSHFEIFNFLGIKLLTGELDGEYTTINAEQLPAGLYFLKVGNEVSKFVKE